MNNLFIYREESGVVSYSPVIRSNANPMPLTEDDQQRNIALAVNDANSDIQSNVSVPIDNREGESSCDEGHGSDKVEASDKEIDHDSVVIEETSEDPSSQRQHQESVKENDSEDETPVEEPAVAALDKNEMEGNAEKESEESLARQQPSVENSIEAVEDIATSKDTKESKPDLVEDSSQLEELTKVDSSVADD